MNIQMPLLTESDYIDEWVDKLTDCLLFVQRGEFERLTGDTETMQRNQLALNKAISGLRIAKAKLPDAKGSA